MTMTPTPPKQVEFVATDMSEAREFLDHAYGWRVAVERPAEAEQALRISMTEAGGVTLGRALSAGDVSYVVRGEDYVVFDTLLEGTFEIEHGGGVSRYGPGDLYIANHPRAEFSSSTHDIRVLTATVPSSLLAEVATGFPRQDPVPLEFLSYTPAAGTAYRWRSVSRFVDGLLSDPETAAEPLVAGAAARLLAATALATFPNTVTTVPDREDSADAVPGTLRRAVAFIEANPDVDISLADVARAAYVTPRAVQLAFRRHLGTTPLAYLRRTRLDCAHRQLQGAAAGDGVTVTAVAHRWGFYSSSRFAEYYRAEYGTTPSDTLRGR